MHFRAELRTETKSLPLDGNGPLVFDVRTPSPYVVTLRRPQPTQDDANGMIEFEQSIDSDIGLLLTNYLASGWPTEKAALDRLAGFFDEVRGFAVQKATEVMLTLRWKCGRTHSAHPFQLSKLSWSYDQSSWHRVPPEKPGMLSWEIVRSFDSSQMVAEIVGDLETGKSWPIAYEMLTEARELRGRAPRSAVVIGIGSLEVGVKEFIAARLPAARWLAEFSPSPPLFKILRDYLPQIAERSARPPKSVLDEISDGVELRNVVAHRGQRALNDETVFRLLKAVEDTIWLMEWAKGDDRSWYWISQETRHEYMIEHLIRWGCSSPSLADNDKQALRRLVPVLLGRKGDLKGAIKTLGTLLERLPAGMVNELKKHVSKTVLERVEELLKPAGMSPTKEPETHSDCE